MVIVDKILERVESWPPLHRAILRVWALAPASLKREVLPFVSPAVTLGAVGVILRLEDGNDNIDILLGCHTYNRRQGTPWALLGGALKARDIESVDASDMNIPARALSREIREETNLEVDVVRCVAIDTDWQRRTMDFYFECSLRDGCSLDTANLNPEIERLDWFHLSNLPAGMLPQHKRFLKDIWPRLQTLTVAPWYSHKD